MKRLITHSSSLIAPCPSPLTPRPSTLITLCSLLLAISSLLANPLPDYWTRYDQMKATMDSLAVAFPSFIKVEALGSSDTENITIWGAKLSNNVHERLDRPRILIIGQIHAEEIIGNEIAMKLMRDMVYKRNQEPYFHWLANLETWIVPSMNPEGLQVVLDGLDPTFRKNKRDTNGNGIFDFVPGQGYDLDGVDLARNWDNNWVHGDTLYSMVGTELYDYYRGAFPFSEGECRAIRDLAIREKFIYAIVWHSSRTGLLSEKVFIPYNFSDIRPAVDWDINNTIGTGVALQIKEFNGSLKYSPLPARTRKGDQHVWFYSKLGTLMLMIECGTSGDAIQPPYNDLMEIISECNKGMYWLFNRALPSPPGTNTIMRSLFTGTVKDDSTGEPLVAEIIIHGRESEALSPRLSNAEHGRFWRPLLPGDYTYTVRKKGYQPVTNMVTLSSTGWTIRHIRLQPLTPVNINLTVKVAGEPTPAFITLSDPCGDDKYETTNGFIEINTFVGTRTLTIITDSGVPHQRELNLTHSTELVIDLTTAEILFSDDFSGNLDKWTIESGPWQIMEADLGLFNSAEGTGMRRFLTDSWGGNGFYESGCDWQIQTANPILIPENQDTYLLFDQHLYTEWEKDFAIISVSTDLENWHEVYRKAGRIDFWHPNLINLSNYSGMSLYVNFRILDADGAGFPELTDQGWSTDNVKVLSATATVSSKDEVYEKPVINLLQNYPNPFNPETKIAFTIKNTQFQKAFIDIFNVKGQNLQTISITGEDAKNGFVIWNAEKLSSGVYLYRLQVDSAKLPVRKALLLK